MAQKQPKLRCSCGLVNASQVTSNPVKNVAELKQICKKRVDVTSSKVMTDSLPVVTTSPTPKQFNYLNNVSVTTMPKKLIQEGGKYFFIAPLVGKFKLQKKKKDSTKFYSWTSTGLQSRNSVLNYIVMQVCWCVPISIDCIYSTHRAYNIGGKVFTHLHHPRRLPPCHSDPPPLPPFFREKAFEEESVTEEV